MNVGTTLPRLPSTLPKRTDTYGLPRALARRMHRRLSAMRLVAPMTLVGRTALSVEISTSARRRTRRSARRRSRAEDVVEDRLVDVRFHERHVLVRRRVEYRVRAVLARRPRAGACQSRTSTIAGSTRDARDTTLRSSWSSSKIEFSPRPSATIMRGLELRELTAQLAADRPAGAGDEHRSAASRATRPDPDSFRSGRGVSRSWISIGRSALTAFAPERISYRPGRCDCARRPSRTPARSRG